MQLGFTLSTTELTSLQGDIKQYPVIMDVDGDDVGVVAVFDDQATALRYVVWANTRYKGDYKSPARVAQVVFEICNTGVQSWRPVTETAFEGREDAVEAYKEAQRSFLAMYPDPTYSSPEEACNTMRQMQGWVSEVWHNALIDASRGRFPYRL